MQAVAGRLRSRPHLPRGPRLDRRPGLPGARGRGGRHRQPRRRGGRGPGARRACRVRGSSGAPTATSSAAANLPLDEGTTAPFLLVLHDDVRLDPDAVRLLVEETFRSNAGIAGRQARRLGRARSPPPGRHVGRQDGLAGVARRPGRARPGAARLGPRRLLRARRAARSSAPTCSGPLGGFDAEMRVVGEDLDLCWRAHVAGARVLVAPSSRAAHREALAERAPAGGRGRLARRHRVRTLLTCYSARPPGACRAPGARAGGGRDAVRPAHRPRQRSARHRRGLDVEPAALGRAPPAPSRRSPPSAACPTRRSAPSRCTARPASPPTYGARSSVATSGSGAWAVSGAPWRCVCGSRPPSGRSCCGSPSWSSSCWAAGTSSPGRSRRSASWWPSPTPAAPRCASTGRPAPCPGWGAMRRPRRCSPRSGSPASPCSASWRCCAPSSSWAACSWASSAPGDWPHPTRSWRVQMAALVAYVAIPVGYNAIGEGHLTGMVAYALAPVPAGRHRPGGRWVARGARRRPATAWPLWPPCSRSAAWSTRCSCSSARSWPWRWPAARCWSGQPAGSGRLIGVSFGAAALGGLVLLPWSLTWGSSWEAFARPRHSPVDPATADDILRFATGGLGAGPLGYAILVAAALPLLIGRDWRLVWAVRGWIVALVAWAVALAGAQGWLPVALPPLEMILAPGAAGLALAVAMGVAAFEIDLREFHFGWRQLVSLVAGVALVAATLPVLGDVVVDGAWGAPGRSLDRTVAFIDDEWAADTFRVVWLGDPEVLPLTGWSFDDAVTYQVTSTGAPAVRDLFPADPGGRQRAAARRARRGGRRRHGAARRRPGPVGRALPGAARPAQLDRAPTCSSPTHRWSKRCPSSSISPPSRSAPRCWCGRTPPGSRGSIRSTPTPSPSGARTFWLLFGLGAWLALAALRRPHPNGGPLVKATRWPALVLIPLLHRGHAGRRERRRRRGRPRHHHHLRGAGASSPVGPSPRCPSPRPSMPRSPPGTARSG